MRVQRSRSTRNWIWVAVAIVVAIHIYCDKRRENTLRNVIYWREDIEQGIGNTDSLRRLEQKMIGTANERWDMQSEGKPRYPFFWDYYNEGRHRR